MLDAGRYRGADGGAAAAAQYPTLIGRLPDAEWPRSRAVPLLHARYRGADSGCTQYPPSGCAGRTGAGAADAGEPDLSGRLPLQDMAAARVWCCCSTRYRGAD
ncbi:hypothetical protein, partial [Fodinicola feengrottensis]|uniref:hypothetical protein n=1 Tax=Fodinicola feengrottensis TaxID=435914 RepID=UPI0024418132